MPLLRSLRDRHRWNKPLVRHSVVKPGLGLARPEQGRLHGAPAWLGERLRRFRLKLLRCAIADIAGDESAAPLVGRDPALRGQFVVGLDNGFAVHLEVFGEVARAGQAVARGEPPR